MITTGLLALALAAAAPPDDPMPILGGADAAALIREGSYVVQVNGTIQRGGPQDWWTFRVSDRESGAAVDEMLLLPCTLLASLEDIAESRGDEPAVFDLTGQVFVYRGRNYLLPTHAPRLVEHVEPAPSTDPASDGTEPADEGSPETILRELDERVGPVARSPRAGGAPPTASPERLLPPGTLLRWRRGWMVREAGGAWSFVFEADASGGADPPMTLMPCLLLEEMERHAQRSGPSSPLLASGRVYRYRGRNYLLPTMFQVPRDHSPLRP